MRLPAYAAERLIGCLNRGEGRLEDYKHNILQGMLQILDNSRIYFLKILSIIK